METFLHVTMFVSVMFHLIVFYMLPRVLRIVLYNHRILAAIAVLVTDFMMLIFVGAGSIAGVGNIAGGLVLAAWIFLRGAVCKDRAVIQWVWLIIPKLVIQRRLV